MTDHPNNELADFEDAFRRSLRQEADATPVPESLATSIAADAAAFQLRAVSAATADHRPPARSWLLPIGIAAAVATLTTALVLALQPTDSSGPAGRSGPATAATVQAASTEPAAPISVRPTGPAELHTSAPEIPPAPAGTPEKSRSSAAPTGSVVPDLVGLTRSEALAALAGAGWPSSAITIEPTAADVRVDTVVAQDPAAQTAKPRSGRITLTVARIKSADFTNRPFVDVQAQLLEASEGRLQIDIYYRNTNDPSQDGIISGQKLPAEFIDPDASVTFEVWRYAGGP